LIVRIEGIIDRPSLRSSKLAGLWLGCLAAIRSWGLTQVYSESNLHDGSQGSHSHFMHTVVLRFLLIPRHFIMFTLASATFLASLALHPNTLCVILGLDTHKVIRRRIAFSAQHGLSYSSSHVTIRMSVLSVHRALTAGAHHFAQTIFQHGRFLLENWPRVKWGR
jgi:hypothetical protein